MVEAPVIDTRGLSKRYGAARGIEDLDLIVHRGETFGCLGPNGAGKTTTIRLLLDLIRPSAGAARVFGLDSHRDSLAIRRRVGYLPGDLRLYASLSGRELLDYFGHLRGSVPRDRIARLAERLDCDLRRTIRELSSGNRQKLGLIQAFMSDPELLILDEPTNGLDPLVQQTFYELLAEAHAEGRSVFLSSHVLPEVERVCHRVGILREGRLVAVESIGSLRARAVRRLEVEFAAAPPAAVFRELPEVRDVTVATTTLRFTVVGDVDRVLKALARYEVRTLTCVEPGLEEVFLAYYGSNGGVPPAHADRGVPDAA